MPGNLKSGGYSIIWEVQNKKSNLSYACKIINIDQLDSGDLKNIYTEIELLKSLNHPNIVKLIDVFKENSKFFIILELLKGGELFERIVEKDHFSEQEAAENFIVIVDTINYLHNLNIMHRDLKPENILYETDTENSILKIIDFGSSRILSSKNTMWSTVCGTDYYLSPEVLNGNKYSKPSDIWALGIILYIMLSGFFPFPDENNSELLNSINSNKIDFTDEVWNNISEEAKDLIEKLLCNDQDKRIKSFEIKNHKWFKNNLNDKNIGNLKNLKSFLLKLKLKKAQNVVYTIEVLKNLKINKNK